MCKFLKINKLYKKINLRFTSILKYNLIIIIFNNLKKINKGNNKKMKVLDHLMNL